MKNKILLGIIFSIFISSTAHAGLVTAFKTYATNDQVTAANLNGNINTIISEMNGGLDNTNADTTAGYRFYQVVGTLPAAGTEGKMVFLTTDDSINFDTGSTWTRALAVPGTLAQGDIFYYNGSAFVLLNAGTANYPLVTNGAGANPAYEQLTSTGVTSLIGTAVDKSADYGSQQATTDLFITATISTPGAIYGYTDSTATPTTAVARDTDDASGFSSISFMVRKGDYWRIEVAAGAHMAHCLAYPIGS